MILWNTIIPVYAELPKSGKTIRVGCVDIDNFLVQKEDGTVSGYGAEYLEEIAKYTGWNYEYISGTWNECMDRLKNGEIDLLLPAEYSSERAEDYSYSTLECFIDYVALLSRGDDTSLYYEDYHQFSGLTVGMIEGNFLNTQFEKFAAEKGFSYKTKYFPNAKALKDGLSGKEVDAIVTGNMSIGDNQKLLAKFDYIPTYFITNKNDQTTLQELNEAMYQIKLRTPKLVPNLMEKYYGSMERQIQSFSREEAAFITHADTITVACNDNNYPFSWYDEKSKTFRGIDLDILEKLSQISGLQFKIKRTATFDDAWKMMQEGTIDLLLGVHGEDSITREYHINFTTPYINEYLGGVAKKDNIITNDRHITAVLPSSMPGTLRYMQIEHPKWTFLVADTMKEGMDAVQSGKADVTFLNSYYLQTEDLLPKYPDLSVVLTNTEAVPISIGVSNYREDMRSQILYSVIDKSLLQISEESMNQFVVHNIQTGREPLSLKECIYKYPLYSVIFVAILITIVAMILMLLYGMMIRARKNQILTAKNVELEEAVAVAEKANAAKSEFLSLMSHEIRTPMNAIMGITRLLLADDMDEKEIREYLIKMNISSEHLLALINDVLEMSRIERHKVVLDPNPYRISDVIEAVDMIIRPLALARGVEYHSEMQEVDQQIFLFDKMRLQQIFINLLNNSVKFTNAGGRVSLCVSKIASAADSVTLLFQVEDNGIGISKEFLPHLYDEFEREEGGRTSEYSGTGLGLTIVKNLVQLMDGTIEVESQVGKGTKFQVTLCFTKCEKTKLQVEDRPAKDGTHPSEYYFEQKRVLLAEDHPLNREIAQRLLERVGITVEIAENGQMAVEKFVNVPPYHYDLILMDIRMPVMDGYQAAEHIRNSGRVDCDIPILAMSANAFREDKKESLAHGMNEHLAKPIELKELYETLEKYMGYK
ncbi:MAG: transporter substrate-binding domain-containing protein [Lachnospiraceae bacterium]|nr:transporter substrate-binding domain-containing protein [Lachnospiraceae bacterium]